MAALRRFLLRLRNGLLPGRAEADLAREVAAHLALLEDELQRRGLGPAEARAAARRSFGGVDQAKDRQRDSRSFVWLDEARRDVLHAGRRLRASPVVALTAVLSLAIGIGANTAIFTIVNAMLLRPVAGVVDPARLVDIGRVHEGEDFDNNSYPNFVDVRRRATTLSEVYAFTFDARPMSLGAEAGAERVYGAMVSANYFDALGTRAQLGRLFRDADGEGAAASSLITVISHRLWQRHFGSDPAIAGRSLVLNGHPFTIVGVAPEGFHGTTFVAPDLWAPLGTVAQAMPRIGGGLLQKRGSSWLIWGGRLAPGVSLAQCRAELDGIGRALAREFPADNEGRALRVVPSTLVPGHTGPVAGFLGLLMAVVGLVLAVACVNLAGVLLARGAARRREIAVRLAIGAGRAHLVRLLLAESLVLFAGGAAGGLLLARWMTSALVALLPSLPVPVEVALPLDGRVLLFTLGLTLAAALLTGLVPALDAARTDVLSGLKADSQSRAPLRLRSGLLVGQIALSASLVVGAFLLLHALQRAGAIDPGFDMRDVELTSLDLSLAGYTEATGPVFARELLARVRALPAVRAATLARVVPLGDSGLGLGDLRVPGVPWPGDKPPSVDWNVVEPGYFQTLGARLERGRDFADADAVGTLPVAIVNETLARRFFPGQEALGKVLDQEVSAHETRRLTIVGIARDAKYRSLGEGPRAFVYVPLQQQYLPSLTLITRIAPHAPVQAEVRQLVAALDPNLPIVGAQSFEDHAALGLVPQRIAASVAGGLGLLSLVLAAVGIYGVTAYAVVQRTREIGIRVALGARHADVIGMMLARGLALAGSGLGIGLLISSGLSRLLGSLLFGVPPLDAVAFGGTAFLFLATALAACLVPVLRAARLDPIAALRYE